MTESNNKSAVTVDTDAVTHSITITWDDGNDASTFLKAVDAHYPNKQGALFIRLRAVDAGGVILPALCGSRYSFKFYEGDARFITFYHWGDTARTEDVKKPGATQETVGAILYRTDSKMCWLVQEAGGTWVLPTADCPITMSPIRTAVLVLSRWAGNEQLKNLQYMGGWHMDASYSKTGAARRENHAIFGFCIESKAAPSEVTEPTGAWVQVGRVLCEGKVNEPTTTDPRDQTIAHAGATYNLQAIRRCYAYMHRVMQGVATNVTSAMPGDALQLLQVV